MGTEPRNTLGTGPKHDFYNRQDIDVTIYIQKVKTINKLKHIQNIV